MGRVCLAKVRTEVRHCLVGRRTVTPCAAIFRKQLVGHEHLVGQSDGGSIVDGFVGLVLCEALDVADAFPERGDGRVGRPCGGEFGAVRLDVVVVDGTEFVE